MLIQSNKPIALNIYTTDFQSNLKRAWKGFGEDGEEKRKELVKGRGGGGGGIMKSDTLRACTFGLCVFHSLLLGRKRFGSRGKVLALADSLVI